MPSDWKTKFSTIFVGIFNKYKYQISVKTWNDRLEVFEVDFRHSSTRLLNTTLTFVDSKMSTEILFLAATFLQSKILIHDL